MNRFFDIKIPECETPAHIFSITNFSFNLSLKYNTSLNVDKLLLFPYPNANVSPNPHENNLPLFDNTKTCIDPQTTSSIDSLSNNKFLLLLNRENESIKVGTFTYY